MKRADTAGVGDYQVAPGTLMFRVSAQTVQVRAADGRVFLVSAPAASALASPAEGMTSATWQSLADRGLVLGCSATPRATTSILVIGDGLLATGVHTAANSAGAARRGDLHDIVNLDPTTSVVVVCADAYRRRLFAAANQAAVAAGVRIVRIYAEGNRFFIGPFVEPTRTACLLCAELRVRAATTRHDELLDYWEYLGQATLDDPAGVSQLDETSTTLAVAVMSNELLGVAAGRPPRTANVLLEVVPTELRLTPHPTLAVPSCPDCGDGSLLRLPELEEVKG